MTESKPRRSGGRAARQEARSQKKKAVAPYLERRLKPVAVIDEAGLVQIEENAEIILSEIGIAFQDFPSALGLWRDAGADIDGDIVRFPRGLCRKIISDFAPASYVQQARSTDRSVTNGEP